MRQPYNNTKNQGITKQSNCRKTVFTQRKESRVRLDTYRGNEKIWIETGESIQIWESLYTLEILKKKKKKNTDKEGRNKGKRITKLEREMEIHYVIKIHANK